MEKTIKVVTKTFMKEKEEVLNVLTPYTNGDIFDIWFDFDKVWCIEISFYFCGGYKIQKNTYICTDWFTLFCIFIFLIPN